jgi:thioredoxin reductase (NADPH)
VVEAIAPGGQAGNSSRIENYLGFPTGISGQMLAARAQVQAQKFGARLMIARSATALDCSGLPFCLALDDGTSISARSVVVASGARYRRLDLPELSQFEGQGVHYAATSLEGGLCSGSDVIVVGGGNSAGQAAVFLSGKARHVHILGSRQRACRDHVRLFGKAHREFPKHHPASTVRSYRLIR